MPEGEKHPLQEPKDSREVPITDMPEERIEQGETSGIESEREVFEQLYELVQGLDADDNDAENKKDYLQLRDMSKELRKITRAMEHILQAGGATERAEDIVRAVIDQARDAESAYQFGEGLIDRSKLPSGDLLDFNTYYTQGLAVEQEQIDRQQAA